MPKHSALHVAHFDWLRLHLVKLASSSGVPKTRVMLELTSAYTNKAILRLAC
jgi:hypothetical protein